MAPGKHVTDRINKAGVLPFVGNHSLLAEPRHFPMTQNKFAKSTAITQMLCALIMAGLVHSAVAHPLFLFYSKVAKNALRYRFPSYHPVFQGALGTIRKGCFGVEGVK